MNKEEIEEFARKAISKTLPNKTFSKVFCIGANKTATTTLYMILKAMALNMANEHEQQLLIVKQLFRGNYEPFKKFVDMYDGFQDVPFSIEDWYIAADALYPNSKFILTIRDPEDWYRSLSSFHKKIFGVDDVKQLDGEFFKANVRYLYPGYVHSVARRDVLFVRDGNVEEDWSYTYDKDLYIQSYIDRNNRIIKYFEQRPNDLLVIDLIKEKDNSKVVEFLGFPEEVVFDMPQFNKTEDVK